jgi:two-component system response regulator NreC
MSITTIVLADDHHIVRQGLRALLEAEPDFAVAGEAADGLAVADLVERLKPDVLVLDLMMPGLNGLDVVRQVKRRSPQTRVIILSMHANEAYVLEALRNGVAGYVLKDSTASDLAQAVREAAAGRRYLSPPLSERAIEAYAHKADAAPLDLYETLSGREREVLHLAAEGCNNTEIAARLCISARTVETHRANAMRKLGLRNQTDLIRYALRRGILPMEE